MHKRSLVRALALSSTATLLLASIVVADNVESDVVVGGPAFSIDANGNRSLHYTAGATDINGDPVEIEILYSIDNTNSGGGPAYRPCDATAASPAYVTIQHPAEILSRSESFLTNTKTLKFEACDVALSVFFSSATPGTYLVTASVLDDFGDYNTNPAKFGFAVGAAPEPDPDPDPDPDVNTAPVAVAGGPYEGGEGEAIGIDGSASSDADGDDLSYLWSIDASSIDAGGSCAFADATAAQTTVTCDDDGLFELTLTVMDDSGDDATDSHSDTADLDVSNVDPSIDDLAWSDGSVACPTAESNGDPMPNATLTFDFSDDGSNDTHQATVDWGDGSDPEDLGSVLSGDSASHVYEIAGVYAATVTLVDDDEGVDSEDAGTELVVEFNVSGILQPINLGAPTSIFKWGSTLPVKVRIQDCDGSYPDNVAPMISVVKLSGSTPASGVHETISSTSGADSGTTMRFADNQYIYNLSTRSLADKDATYRITISIPLTDQTVEAVFGTRR